MDFQPSERCIEFQERLSAFMDEHVYPAEPVYQRQLAESGDPHHQPAVMEELKGHARAAGLWNMFLPDADHGAGLSNSDYAPLAEILGRSHIASEACNCSAPDTGNMEVLHQFATEEQKQQWLNPLLEGEIRSSFAMTEPDVASSDATNIALRIERSGDEYVLNGRKWWISGALHPHCKIMIVMGKSSPRRPGIVSRARSSCRSIHRRADRARLARLRLPGPGGPRRNPLRGRARAGKQPDRRRGRRFHDRPGTTRPGAHPSLHALDRRRRAGAGGHVQAGRGAHDLRPTRGARANIQDWIAEARIEIEMARLLTLKAAWLMDTVGNRHARTEIAAIKVAAPSIALKVIDRAIQVHGGGGVSDDFPLAWTYAHLRTLRLADGPDEVHKLSIARRELAPYMSAEAD